MEKIFKKKAMRRYCPALKYRMSITGSDPAIQKIKFALKIGCYFGAIALLFGILTSVICWKFLSPPPPDNYEPLMVLAVPFFICAIFFPPISIPAFLFTGFMWGSADSQAPMLAPQIHLVSASIAVSLSTAIHFLAGVILGGIWAVFKKM